MIMQYLRSRYQSGGRGPAVFDCYGLARHARASLFQCPWLEAHEGVSDSDKRAMTRICKEIGLRPALPAPGVLATCWRGELFHHVGICIEIDGRLGVLETSRKTGPRWLHIAEFERIYSRVIYYDD